MKTKFITLVISSFLFVSCTSLQKTSETKYQLLTSKSLVGIWNQGFIDSKRKVHRSRNFKIINSDGTFYLMTVKSDATHKDTHIPIHTIPTGITGYGTYEITSDNTFTEHVEKHFLNPKISGTNSKLRYKVKTPDLLIIEYKNEAVGKWIPEMWIRVKPLESN